MPDKETLKVYLRIKPFTRAEREDGEDQGVVHVASSSEVVLCAPKVSKAYKVRAW